MSYLPEDTTIRNIFNSDLIYSVPRFQRKYVWDSFNWSDFLGDLERSNVRRYHFVGCLIFEKLGNINEKRIVDGQQRLTTSLVLISLIGKYFAYNHAFDKREALRKYCFWTDSDNQSTIKLQNNFETSLGHLISRFCFIDSSVITVDEFLKQERIESKTNIVECFKYFEDKLKKKLDTLSNEEQRIESLEKLRDSLLGLRCISITAEQEQEGYLIFEVLNSRGMPLSQHELIKNYLFMHDSVVDGSDAPLQCWQQIEQNVDSSQNISSKPFDSFFSDYIIHEFGEKNKKQTDFAFFRDSVAPDSVHQTIVDIVDKSRLYKKFLCGESDSAIERYVFKFFLKFRITIIRPMLLSLSVLFTNGIVNKEYYEKTLFWLKNYFARYIVVFGQRTNAIDSVIKKAASDLSCTTINKRSVKIIINEIKSSLIEKIPIDKDFREEFQKMMIYSNHKELFSDYKFSSKNKYACQFALEEYEIKFGSIEDCTISKFSIEHIKNDSEGGKACLIGNLVPLQSRRNNGLASKSPSEKILTYKNSTYRATLDLVGILESKTGSWTDLDIVDRSRKLAKLFDSNIWSLK